MKDNKPWYVSKTIWASVLQVLTGIAVSLGVLNEAAGDIVIGEGPELIVGVVVAILGVWSFVGRIVATKKLSS